MNRIADWWRRRFGEATTALVPRPTLAAATRQADELMGRSGPDADGYVDPFARTARDVLAGLLYAGALTEADSDQLRQWAQTYSPEPYDVLRNRVSGQAEDPDARTALEPLLRVYRYTPDRTRAAVMVQVVGALETLQRW